MRKIVFALALVSSTSAFADPYGTYFSPVEDPPFTGDWSAPVHRGMYCVQGTWHHGWLREWEGAIVVKPSCGTAVYQMPL